METGAISHSEIVATISDADGGQLPGVAGVLTGSIVGTREEVSNAQGRMAFRELPPGAYEIAFSLEGFATVRRSVTIHETREVDPLEIVMRLAEA